ncbi:hypothetical protein [Streptomyces noursei]|uniref:Uncharacterized protein n=1 Tax=Streptomyces noursei TaxID=1971 RepID=A0A2N8PR12_STRNR|nr:hypothetical protein [Streptomyces noursei]PNE43411.1 hypothetical protein AOB60_00230 [Streptomyces noursei]
MRRLLLGHWDWGGNLVVISSTLNQALESERSDALVTNHMASTRDAWAAEFDTADHDEAITAAFDKYVYEERDGKHAGDTLIDRITGRRLPAD